MNGKKEQARLRLPVQMLSHLIRKHNPACLFMPLAQRFKHPVVYCTAPMALVTTEID